MTYCLNLTNVLDFGSQPLGNGFLTLNEFSSEYFYRMQLGFSEESMMLQLLKQPEPEQMFHENYAFFSSTSIAMAKHFTTSMTWLGWNLVMMKF